MLKMGLLVASYLIILGFACLGVWVFDMGVNNPILSGYLQYITIGSLPIVGAMMGWILNEVRYWE